MLGGPEKSGNGLLITLRSDASFERGCGEGGLRPYDGPGGRATTLEGFVATSFSVSRMRFEAAPAGRMEIGATLICLPPPGDLIAVRRCHTVQQTGALAGIGNGLPRCRKCRAARSGGRGEMR